MSKRKPHKHSKLIHRWAEGATIQRFLVLRDKWVDTSDNYPTWNPETEYRVKPSEIVKLENKIAHAQQGIQCAQAAMLEYRNQLQKLESYNA